MRASEKPQRGHKDKTQTHKRKHIGKIKKEKERKKTGEKDKKEREKERDTNWEKRKKRDPRARCLPGWAPPGFA